MRLREVTPPAGRSAPGVRYHGDQDAAPGLVDFAVNVRHPSPPDWLRRRLADRLTDLGRYPTASDERTAVAAVAARHGVPGDHVLLLSGGAEGFALLPQLRPRLAALLTPSFTEPEAVLGTAGIPIRHAVTTPPFRLEDADFDEQADLVVLGNPTNPTGVLHPRATILALRRPGRVIVVDEAFADAIPGEPESLAGPALSEALPDVLVLRSLTKTWGLAGLRVGYALGDPGVLARLSARRPHWPLGTLQLEAIAACCEPQAVAAAEAEAERLADTRGHFVAALRSLGLEVVDGRAPFVMIAVDDPTRVRDILRTRGIAVRRCDTFTGLADRYLRLAVRSEWPLLVEALAGALR